MAVKHRICLFSSVHPVADVRILHKEAKALVKAGFEVRVLGPVPRPSQLPVGAQSAYSESGIRNQDSRLRSTEQELRCQLAVRCGSPAVVPVRLPDSRSARVTVGAIRLLLHLLKQDAAAYHFHDPELMGVGLLLKLAGKRVVYDVHEDFPQKLYHRMRGPTPLRRLARFVFGHLEKLAAQCLDGVVAATDAIGMQFPRCRQVVVVRNFPVESTLQGAPRPEPESGIHAGNVDKRKPESGRRDGCVRICHLASTLSESRGITNLVRAMGLLGDGYELVLAGSYSPPAYEDELRDVPGFERVRRLGPMPHEEVWGWYRECDIGVVLSVPLPHYLVALPVKLFEFMAAGLPVVVSDFPLLREIVEGNGCGICVNPLDPRAAARAFERLGQDPELRRFMGNRGRAAVGAKYGWTGEANRLTGFYQSMVESTLLPSRASSTKGRFGGSRDPTRVAR